MAKLREGVKCSNLISAEIIIKMIHEFGLVKTPKIIFGTGSIVQLWNEIYKNNAKVLFVTGDTTLQRGGLKDVVEGIIKKAGVKPFFISVKNEPSPLFIDSVCNTFRKENIDYVVGIGGGSVLDSGKAISAMLLEDEGVKVFLEGVGTKNPSGMKVPFIAIPTTSGTGSETTSNAVFSEVGENGFKKSLRHPNYVPNVAIVDPELTISCPPKLTGATGMDAFTQLLESYLSTKSNPYVDALAFEGMQQIKKGLKKAYRNGNDVEARTSVAFASMTSGISLANAGLGTVHGFASALGGIITVPHGVVCGSLMAVCNDHAVKKMRKEDPDNIALRKYVKVGRMFVDATHTSDEYCTDAFIEMLYNWIEEFCIDGFGSYGFNEEHITSVIALTENKNNPVDFSKEELEEMLRTRI